MGELKKMFMEAWTNHRGKLLGAALGIFIGICIMAFGFFKTVFVLMCGLVGLFVGKRMDDQEDFHELVDKIVPPGFRR